MQLVIGNKNYSSWSMRPWLAMRQAGIEFEEILVPLDQPDTRTRILGHSPGGKVPILKDGPVMVWDSLAILEYLAEARPQSRLWPEDRSARAHARAISAEMHSGYQALRKACPMNLKKRFAFRDRGEEVTRDAVRVIDIWRDCRTRFGGDGPFLFGAFTNADAMFAPVVTRLDTYSFPVDPTTRTYMDEILSLPAFLEWREAGLAEPWVLRHDEVDEPEITEA